MNDELNSAADRLERALKDLEERNKAIAELAVESAPALERMRAWQAKVDALSQRDRRQLFDSLGMTHVSAVPRPIEPGRGSGPPAEPRALRSVRTVREAQSEAPASAEPLAAVAEPVPLVMTPAASEPTTAWTPHRRADLLKEFRALEGKRPTETGKKGKRGALMELARKTGVDKDTLGEQLDKAIAEKKMTDMWTQLTAK